MDQTTQHPQLAVYQAFQISYVPNGTLPFSFPFPFQYVPFYSSPPQQMIPLHIQLFKPKPRSHLWFPLSWASQSNLALSSWLRPEKISYLYPSPSYQHTLPGKFQLSSKRSFNLHSGLLMFQKAKFENINSDNVTLLLKIFQWQVTGWLSQLSV